MAPWGIYTLRISTDHDERKSPYRTALVDAGEETGSRTWSDGDSCGPVQDLSRIEDVCRHTSRSKRLIVPALWWLQVSGFSIGFRSTYLTLHLCQIPLARLYTCLRYSWVFRCITPSPQVLLRIGLDIPSTYSDGLPLLDVGPVTTCVPFTGAVFPSR